MNSREAPIFSFRSFGTSELAARTFFQVGIDVRGWAASSFNMAKCFPSDCLPFCLESSQSHITLPLLKNAPLAQLAEQVTLNHWVVGSIPTRCKLL
jgi:hypothetical protein